MTLYIVSATSGLMYMRILPSNLILAAAFLGMLPIYDFVDSYLYQMLPCKGICNFRIQLSFLPFILMSAVLLPASLR